MRSHNLHLECANILVLVDWAQFVVIQFVEMGTIWFNQLFSFEEAEDGREDIGSHFRGYFSF